MDCSKTEVYFAEKTRLTHGCMINCKVCRLSSIHNNHNVDCIELQANHPIDAINLIQKWSDEHPVKTRQSEFIKLFPNTRIDVLGIISIQPCLINKELSTDCISEGLICSQCRREFWSKELEG